LSIVGGPRGKLEGKMGISLLHVTHTCTHTHISHPNSSTLLNGTSSCPKAEEKTVNSHYRWPPKGYRIWMHNTRDDRCASVLLILSQLIIIIMLGSNQSLVKIHLGKYLIFTIAKDLVSM
jgi:hypothetical protein